MNSKDFLSQLMASVTDHRKKLLAQSWCLQDSDEQQFRLRFIVELSAELAQIRAVTNFATGSAESILGFIIEGEWDRARESAQLLRFKHESEELRTRCAPLWESFVQITEAGAAQAKARSAGGLKPS